MVSCDLTHSPCYLGMESSGEAPTPSPRACVRTEQREALQRAVGGLGLILGEGYELSEPKHHSHEAVETNSGNDRCRMLSLVSG